MQEVKDASIIMEKDGYTEENMLFTYSDEEMQENAVNRENAQLVFYPDFIPFYRDVQDRFRLTDKQTIIYGFIRFYKTKCSGKFYFTDEQLGKVAGCHANTAQEAISCLKKLNLIKVGHRIKAGGGTIRFVKSVVIPIRSDCILPVQENIVPIIQENLGTNKNKIKENIYKYMDSKESNVGDIQLKEQKEYGNTDINRFIKGINKYLTIKLPEDARARRVAKNSLNLFTKFDKRGNIKKGREFLNNDKWENVKMFLAAYTAEKINKGYSAQSWDTLYKNIKLWIANNGRLGVEQEQYRRQY